MSGMSGMSGRVGVGAPVVRTAEALDALPVGTTIRLRTACAAAVKAPDGRWTVTGMDMPREQARDGIAGTLPHYILDVPGESASKASGRAVDYRDVQMVEVRRFGSDDTTVIALDGKQLCGLGGAHIDRGCIFMRFGDVHRNGRGVQVHATTQDALRLSDLLRALASTEETPDV